MSASLRHEQIDELLALRAAHGLSEQEHREVETLVRERTDRLAESYERAAAAIHLAFHGQASEPLPESLRRRLLEAAMAHRPQATADRDPVVARIGMTPAMPAPARSSRAWAASGWIAAAACLAFAAWVGLSRPGMEPQPRTAYELLAARADVKRASWTDWDNPEVRGVTGEVVWCEREQRGYLVLRGLPQADPSNQVYQLWIVDRRGLTDERGQSARISGGVFTGAPGEVIIPVKPAISVDGAKAFAITIEKPGGTWVSTMERRVVIASLESGSKTDSSRGSVDRQGAVAASR